MATLALAAGQPVTVSRLLEALTGSSDRLLTPVVVRVYITELRKRFLPETPIETLSGSRGYRLRIDPAHIDASRFRALLGRRDQGPEDRLRTIEEALGLWRGPALADVHSDHLHQEHAVPLEQLRLAALEELYDLRVRLGRLDGVVQGLRELIAVHPLREPLYGHLMLALYRQDNAAEALEVYETLRRVLKSELGTDPSAKLRRLHALILREDAALDHEESVAPAELPRDDPNFTGRDRLLARLDAALGNESQGPVTIVLHGHAGIGKSALAIHLGWRHRSAFPDGQLFEDLTGQTDLSAILARFLRSMGVPGGMIPSSLRDRVSAYRTLTADRRMLVVLDNVETEEQARVLLPSGPRTAAIITSRSALAGLSGSVSAELDVFDAEEARALLERLGGRERIAADDAGTAQLLAACGGLPIAVRIVGSWLASHDGTPARALAKRLRDDPLSALQAGDIAVRPLFALCYDGLSDDLKTLLRRLSLLSAPSFAPWIAEPLAGRPAAMGTIADRGLLQRLATDEAGQDRYRLHSLTRLYAREQLADEDALQPITRLASTALAKVGSMVLPFGAEEPETGMIIESASMDTTDIRDSAEWLDAELPFLTAFLADLDGLPEYAWRLGHVLTPYLKARLRLDEWRTANRLARDAARRVGEPRAEALVSRDLGDLLHAERDLSGAAAAYRTSLGHLVRHGTTQDRARVLLRLGVVLLEQGDPQAAERHLGKGRAEFREHGDRRGEIECLRVLGVTRHRNGDDRVAFDCVWTAFVMAREFGDRYAMVACLHDLVTIRLSRGETPMARHHVDNEFDLASRRLRDPRLTAHALLNMARVEYAEGGEKAEGHADDAASRLYALGDRHGHAWALAELGRITHNLDTLHRARSIFLDLHDAYGVTLADRWLDRF